MSMLGIDEVGRGPWAGPLVIGAVVLADPSAEWCAELTDSKKLTAKKREKLAPVILKEAAGTGLGWVSSQELDEIGLAEALRLATRRAVETVEKSVENFDELVDNILIDGTNNFLAGTKYEQITSVKPKADLLFKAVSAASIIAKVARDDYMKKLADKYPEYGLEKHVGYGTKAHREALAQYGPCPEHRRSFKPIAKIAKVTQGVSSSVTRGEETEDAFSGLPQDGEDGATNPVTTGVRSVPKKRFCSSPVALRLYSSETPCVTFASSKVGAKAEAKVAEYLRELGHQIVARNHKTKFYEIDIISICNHNIFFTEVKYRKNSNRGTPLEAITPEKQRQMRFAAESFFKFQPELAAKYEPLLAAAAVSGSDFQIDDWLVLSN